jgi:hypothetical protein
MPRDFVNRLALLAKYRDRTVRIRQHGIPDVNAIR